MTREQYEAMLKDVEYRIYALRMSADSFSDPWVKKQLAPLEAEQAELRVAIRHLDDGADPKEVSEVLEEMKSTRR